MAEPREIACNVLLINPRFNGASFWAYRSVCELVGGKYPAPSLGLITVAALLPSHWQLRLIDRNVDDREEELERGLQWADVVLAGGMLPQQGDLFGLIERARQCGTPIAVGGPDVSSDTRRSMIAPISASLAKPKAASINSSRRLGEGRTRWGIPRTPLQRRRHQDPGPAFRPLKVFELHGADGAVLARLSVHVRILRYHRAVRPQAPDKNQCSNARRAAAPVRPGLSRAYPVRRRQSDRQQEGREGLSPGSDRVATAAGVSIPNSAPRRR